MAERGFSLDGQRSKGIDEVPLAEMDVVVRMGREVQFALPDEFRGRLVEWQIPDPYSRGLGFFLHVRDLIEAQVRALLAEAGNMSTGNLSGKEHSEDGGDFGTSDDVG